MRSNGMARVYPSGAPIRDDGVMGELILGTSSWSEKSWVGPFYPEGTPPAEFLAEYARALPCRRGRQHLLPHPVRAHGARLGRAHARRIRALREVPALDRARRQRARARTPTWCSSPTRVGEETERFLAVMDLMGDKLGPLVLQFPYFNKQAFAGPEPFLERLDAYLAALPRGSCRYGVEVRNRAWVGPPLLDLLRRHGVALVLVDLVYMPHPADLAAKLDLVTADFTYARLIGDRKAVEEKTETFDRLVLDKTASLERWAELLRELGERVPKTYVFANNHYAGHGPATIRDLAALLEG